MQIGTTTLEDDRTSCHNLNTRAPWQVPLLGTFPKGTKVHIRKKMGKEMVTACLTCSNSKLAQVLINGRRMKRLDSHTREQLAIKRPTDEKPHGQSQMPTLNQSQGQKKTDPMNQCEVQTHVYLHLSVYFAHIHFVLKQQRTVT